jgi:hypothetical protein
MSIPTLLSRTLVSVGLAGMLIGAICPLKGWVVVLPGLGLAALEELLGLTRRHRLLYWTFALAILGVSAILVLRWLGGIGGNEGLSM